MQADLRRRLLTAGVVLAGGIAAAIPFYHGPTKAAPENRPSNNSTPTGEGDGVSLQIPSEGTDLTSTSGEPAARVLNASDSTTRDAKGSPSEPLTTPQLSNVHPAAENQVPPASAIQRIVNTAVPNDDSSDASGEPRQRMHRIIDGDTLELLARRFLGDASRWSEILDANRDILQSNDILPIDKELRIPPRATSKPVVESKDTASSSESTKANGLVPVPWQQPDRSGE